MLCKLNIYGFEEQQYCQAPQSCNYDKVAFMDLMMSKTGHYALITNYINIDLKNFNHVS
jgi:hypothetical protein